MRYLVTLLLSIALLACGFGVGVVWQQDRDAARERQTNRAVRTISAAKPSAGARTFRASNGVVLTAKELDEQDAYERDLEHSYALFEYSLKKPHSK